jgi:hypothetical protein
MTAVSQPEDGRPGQASAQLAEHQDPQAASPATPRDRLSSPALQGGLAFVIYLVVWVVTSARPLVFQATQALLDQKSQDPNFYVWGLRWWPYAIGHGLDPLFTHEIAAPAGHSLAWVTTAPPVALLAVPLTLIAGPLVSFNLLTAVALPLSAWAAFVLCRRLTGQFWPALVGGAVFGFSAYEVNHGGAGQLNLIYCLLLPVLAYLVILWRDGSISTRAFVIMAALAMAVQFYLMMEIFADLTAILAVALLVGFALAGREGRAAIVRLGKFIGLAYVIAVVLVAPYVVYALDNKPPKPAKVTGMDLASLVIPRPGRTFGIAWLAHAAVAPNHVSQACYVGIPLLLLAVLFAITRWSAAIVRFLTCMLAFIMVAALGPVVYLEGRRTSEVPWAPLFHLPIVKNAYPLRLMLFAYLVLAVATALYLAGPARRVAWASWARWSLAVLVIVFIALDTVPIKISKHTTVPAFISSGEYHHQLSPGEIVVVVSGVGNAGMLWQAESDFYMRISGGYINAGLNHRTDLPRPVQALSDATPDRVAQFEQFVRTDHVGAILLDTHHELKWVGIFRKAGLVGHADGGVIVYPTHGCQFCRAVSWTQLGKAAPSAA